MAKLGRGKKKMQAELKKRQGKTNAFSKKIMAALAAIIAFVVLIFKYMFLALWWVVKHIFMFMAAVCKYIYLGCVSFVKKIAAIFRKSEGEADEGR